VALAYDDPEDGWTNNDGSFVEHFLDRFGKRKVTVRLSFGPELRDKSAAALRKQAHAWIAAQLARAGEAPATSTVSRDESAA
jgi:hypothetical protein